MDLYNDFFQGVDEIKKIKNKVEKTIFTEAKECSHKNTKVYKGSEVCTECGALLRNVNTDECKHTDTTIIEGNEVCTECGTVIQEENTYDWKFLGSAERHSKDPTRCHKRKSDQRTIFKDVEAMEFPEAIIKRANKKYQLIIKDNIYRGSKRKAIIVACIFYAYAEQGEFRTQEEISKHFGIKKKSVKEGFAKYIETFPEVATQYVDAKNLIRQIMVKTGISFSHLQYIQRLCEYLENRSPLLNRSNPQSVAASVVYLYLCLEPEYKEQLGMTKMRFAEIVNLSDITITKLGKESQRVINNEDIKI